jgi:hypothetical protein
MSRVANKRISLTLMAALTLFGAGSLNAQNDT